MSSDQQQNSGQEEQAVFDMPDSAPEQEHVRYGVRFGEFGLLVPDAVFSEVVVKKEVYPLPNTQPWLQGIINDHGDMVPVYDLSLLFGLDSSAGKKNALLIIDQREHAAAIRVPEYPKAVRGGVEIATVGNLPEPLKGHVEKVYQAGGETWIDFRHRAFFMSLKALVTS